jgi:hypothetical protein
MKLNSKAGATLAAATVIALVSAKVFQPACSGWIHPNRRTTVPSLRRARVQRCATPTLSVSAGKPGITGNGVQGARAKRRDPL